MRKNLAYFSAKMALLLCKAFNPFIRYNANRIRETSTIKQDFTDSTISKNSNASWNVVCAVFNRWALLGIPKFKVTGKISVIPANKIVVIHKDHLENEDKSKMQTEEMINLVCMERE